MSDQRHPPGQGSAGYFDNLDETALVLGKDENLIHFDRTDQQQALVTRMLDDTTSSIVLLADRVDSRLWGANGVVASLRHCLQRNRSMSMQILVNSSRDIVQSGQQLAELLRAFMPNVSCRLRRPAPGSFGAGCVVFDRVGYLYTPNSERSHGTASFRDIATTTKLLDAFEQEWRVAQPDPELGPLYI